MKFPGQSSSIPVSKEIRKIRKTLKKKGSRGRIRSLDKLLSIMDANPSVARHTAEGLWYCLSDSNERVVIRTCSIISKGALEYPVLFREFIDPLAKTIRISSIPILNKAAGALTAIALRNEENAKDVMRELRKVYLGELNWENDLRFDVLLRIRINSIYVEIAKRYPRHIPICFRIITKTLKYPFYRPERTNPMVENLYKSTIKRLLAICRISPRMVKFSVPIILKIIGDTQTFGKWIRCARKPNSMFSVFNNAFISITDREPGFASLPMVRNLSTTNKKINKVVRKRFIGLAEKPERIVPPLLACFTNKSSEIRKNAYEILCEIICIKPSANVNILLRCMDKYKDERIRIYLIDALGKLVENTGISIGKRINVLFGMTAHTSPEILRVMIATLGIMAEKDRTVLARTTKHLLKALRHEEPVVRLTALTSLENVLRQYEEIRNTTIPHLIETQKDEKETIRWRSGNILRELGFENDDLEKYLTARKNIEETRAIIKELKKGSVLNLSGIISKMKRAKELMKESNFQKAYFYTDVARGGLIQVRVKHPPRLEFELMAEHGFYSYEENHFTVNVINTGKLHAYNFSISFSEDVEILGGVPNSIKAGVSESIDLSWTPQRVGRQLLILKLAFSDYADYRRSIEKKIWLEVEPQREPSDPDRGRREQGRMGMDTEGSDAAVSESDEGFPDLMMPEEAEKLYIDALKTALADNILTYDELQLLEILRNGLHISMGRHDELEEQIKADLRDIKDVDRSKDEPIPKKATGDDVDEQLTMGLVYFRSGSTRMDVVSERMLMRMVRELRDFPDLNVEITGHTDNRSSMMKSTRKRKAENKRLSLERAKVVRDFLIERRISTERLVVKGDGEERPLGDNSTPEGRRMNQRAELRYVVGPNR